MGANAKVAGLSCTQPVVGSIPTVSTARIGLLVQQEDAGFACRKSGCESPAVHCRPGGETEIIPRFERGVPGSTPGRGAEETVPSFSWQDTPVTWGRSVVRAHPGLLTRGRRGYPIGDGGRLEAG